MTDELLQQAIDSGQVSAAQIEQHRVAGELTPAAPSLKWCNGCGEGYVDFCRGKREACPMAQPIKQGETK